MSLTDHPPGRDRTTLWGSSLEQAAALASLWTLAVTQPVLDVLGNSPSYWIASRAGPDDVVLFVGLATLLPALGLALAAVGVGLVPAPRAAWHNFLFPTSLTLLLAAALFYPASIPLGKPTWLVALCFLAGAAGVFWFRRLDAVRRLLLWSSRHTGRRTAQLPPAYPYKEHLRRPDRDVRCHWAGQPSDSGTSCCSPGI